ncbi:chemotaxis protein CheX [Chengkuizengella axinellae]|uniref:Chemotaxis protein CheX n=1 Tax=Chengkuizengella axinellae TaxID=3064388 RepID=A0ABT9IU49_9BACL|nr:chemotaxis protein CheX [Chengkuizengella sp. 2205SS18-9]MDP5272627.1 chemotaxis protein CheX [Chengkuizengella sp. 2205SS18-9]
MDKNYIHPFLESASNVLEQVVRVRPTSGELEIKDVKYLDRHIWILIGMSGHLKGEILFGLPEQVALKIVSEMMGGFQVNELDDMSQSAISELGNMISGNASTLLFDRGVSVDITPPQIIQSIEHFHAQKAWTIPLNIKDVGEFNIQVLVT